MSEPWSYDDVPDKLPVCPYCGEPVEYGQYCFKVCEDGEGDVYYHENCFIDERRMPYDGS